MSRSRSPAPSGDPEPPKRPRRRWFGATDENGEPAFGSQVDVNDEWSETWPPCPDGDRLRLCHPLGFRERSPRELELRVLLGDDDCGVCQIIVDEGDAEVRVRVLVCREEPHRPRARTRHETDCPVRVELEDPLGGRAVIDMDTDRELLFYTPLYLNNVVQPDHGYRPVNRRRASRGRGSDVGGKIV